MGFESLATRVLRRIFKFSLNTVGKGPHAMDHVVQQCASWRNVLWWRQEKNLQLGNWRHACRGRPARRWEDIFNEFRRFQRAEIMARDVRTWKSLENSFVFFALSQVQCQCIHVEMIQGNESDIQHLREPRQVDQQEFGVHWNSLLDVQHRIELCGDSKVVVNWCEAFWPVRNPRFRDFVHDSMRDMHQWWHLGCQPRMRHTPWCRHIFREYNSLADKLAGEGKYLTSEICC